MSVIYNLSQRFLIEFIKAIEISNALVNYIHGLSLKQGSILSRSLSLDNRTVKEQFIEQHTLILIMSLWRRVLSTIVFWSNIKTENTPSQLNLFGLPLRYRHVSFLIFGRNLILHKYMYNEGPIFQNIVTCAKIRLGFRKNDLFYWKLTNLLCIRGLKHKRNVMTPGKCANSNFKCRWIAATDWTPISSSPPACHFRFLGMAYNTCLSLTTLESLVGTLVMYYLLSHQGSTIYILSMLLIFLLFNFEIQILQAKWYELILGTPYLTLNAINARRAGILKC